MMNVSTDRGSYFEKHIVHPFIATAVQVIVHGRRGKRIITKCTPNVDPRQNFVRLNVENDPEVSNTVNQQLGQSNRMRVNDRVHVSIALSRGSNLQQAVTLEVWEFHLIPFSSRPVGDDVFVRRCRSRFLERQNTLLKSILTANRLLPGYRASQCTGASGPESLQCSYTVRLLSSASSDERIFLHEPSTESVVEGVRTVLGAEYSQRTVGSFPTSSAANQLVVRVYFNPKPVLPPLSQLSIPIGNTVSVPSPSSNSPRNYPPPVNQTQPRPGLWVQQGCFRGSDPLHVVPEEDMLPIATHATAGQSAHKAKALHQPPAAPSPTPFLRPNPQAAKKVRPAFVQEEELCGSDTENGFSSGTEDNGDNVDARLPFRELLMSATSTVSPTSSIRNRGNVSMLMAASGSTGKRWSHLLSSSSAQRTRPNPKRISESVLRFPFHPEGPMAATGYLSSHCDFGDVYTEMKDWYMDVFRTPFIALQEGTPDPQLLNEASMLTDLEKHEVTLLEFDDFVSNFHPDNVPVKG